MRHDCDVSPEQLGPYLLGHLTDEESAQVRNAVQRCPVCAAEVSNLTPVVTALAAASPSRLAVPSSSPAGVDEMVLHGVLATVARERRAARRRRWTLAAVAALVVGVLGLGGVVLVDTLDRSEEGRRVELAGPDASGSAVLVQAAQGTQIELEVDGLEPGRYGVWVEDEQGQRVSAGTFQCQADGWASVELLAGLPLEDTQAIGVTLAGGQDQLRGDLDAE